MFFSFFTIDVRRIIIIYTGKEIVYLPNAFSRFFTMDSWMQL